MRPFCSWFLVLGGWRWDITFSSYSSCLLRLGNKFQIHGFRITDFRIWPSSVSPTLMWEWKKLFVHLSLIHLRSIFWCLLNVPGTALGPGDFRCGENALSTPEQCVPVAWGLWSLWKMEQWLVTTSCLGDNFQSIMLIVGWISQPSMVLSPGSPDLAPSDNSFREISQLNITYGENDSRKCNLNNGLEMARRGIKGFVLTLGRRH